MRSLWFADAVLAECDVARRSVSVLRLSPAICFLPAIPDAEGPHAETGTDQDDAGPICLMSFARKLLPSKKRCRYVDKFPFQMTFLLGSPDIYVSD